MRTFLHVVYNIPSPSMRVTRSQGGSRDTSYCTLTAPAAHQPQDTARTARTAQRRRLKSTTNRRTLTARYQKFKVY
jgi:hypothetical protein